MANVTSNNSIFVGVELNALTKLQPITQNDIVYLQINSTTLGNFTTMGQTAIYADRKNKLHEAAIYGQPDKLVAPDEHATLYPLRAFANNSIAGTEKLWLAQYFDGLAQQQTRDQEIQTLLANIHRYDVDTQVNLSEIENNIHQLHDYPK